VVADERRPDHRSGVVLRGEDVELEATITDIQTPRIVSGKYGQKKITLATLEDDTGEIQVTLWEEQIDEVEEGAPVRVTGAYTRDWAGDLQLNIPWDVSIELVDTPQDN
jgi:replication factor A1